MAASLRADTASPATRVRAGALRVPAKRWSDALDLLGVPWRQSNRNTISVSTRAGVVRLDELIGPKT